MSLKENVSADHNEIPLVEIFGIIKRNIYVFIGCVIIFAIAGYIYSHNLSDVYRSSVTVSPAGEDMTSSTSNLMAGLGGVAALAGIGPVSNQVSKYSLALSMLNSRDFLINFIKKYHLERDIYSTVNWDRNTNKLVYDTSKQSELEVINNSGSETDRNKLYLKLFKIMASRISIQEDSGSGLTLISLEFYSPVWVSDILDKLVYELNEVIKKDDIVESEKTIDYLNKLIQETQLNGMRDLFYSLIEAQTKKKMLADIRKEYVVKTIDTSFVPYAKSKPQRMVLIVAFIFLGAIIGFFVSLIIDTVKSR